MLLTRERAYSVLLSLAVTQCINDLRAVTPSHSLLMRRITLEGDPFNVFSIAVMEWERTKITYLDTLLSVLERRPAGSCIVSWLIIIWEWLSKLPFSVTLSAVLLKGFTGWPAKCWPYGCTNEGRDLLAAKLCGVSECLLSLILVGDFDCCEWCTGGGRFPVWLRLSCISGSNLGSLILWIIFRWRITWKRKL